MGWSVGAQGIDARASKALAAVVVVAIAAGVGATGLRLGFRPDFRQACDAGAPYYAIACYRGLIHTDSPYPYEGDAPSVALFTDTPDDKPYYVAATFDEIGAIWGLAYRSAEQVLYAAAFHKTQLPFGPGGPGAIYRIDLRSGRIDPFVTVPNVGPDRHQILLRFDADGEEWAGRTSLGDLELSTDQSQLFVVNLNDRRIYRFAVPSGQLLGSFATGTATEPWAAESRPFALAYDDGYLFHGVVRSAEDSGQVADLLARVYRSRPDGSQMTQVAAFRLDYPRGTTNKFARPPWNSLAWRPWSDHVYERYDSAPYSLAPMPLLSDIAFDGSANMILGLRDRHMDASRIFHRGFGRGPGNVTVGVGFGDILRGTPNGLSWDVDTTTEHFRDNVAGLGDESALGGLAVRPDGRIIVAGSYAGKLWRGEYVTADGEGGYWYDSATGNPVQHEIVCDPAAAEPLDGLLFRAASVLADDEPATEYRARAVGSVGDVEVLCGPDVLPTTPRPSPSSTPPPTATTTCTPDARPSPTSTATACPTASPTVTAAPRPIHLPLGLREQCVPPKQHTDVALVIDASTSMRDDRTSAGRTKLDAAIEAARTFLATMSLPQDQAAVVAFNDDAKVLQELTGRRADVEAALTQIPRLVRQQTRIDRGIEDGHEELASARHKAVNRAVMIVLTDGLANPEPASTAVRRAQAAKEDKITIFAIGLGRGTELNVVELEQMASRPEYFYLAPDGEDLLAIYRTIALEIPCPADSFWGRR